MLFGSGLNLSAIAFTKFILELGKVNDIKVDIEGHNNSIRTGRQLRERLSR